MCKNIGIGCRNMNKKKESMIVIISTTVYDKFLGCQSYKSKLSHSGSWLEDLTGIKQNLFIYSKDKRREGRFFTRSAKENPVNPDYFL